jgi:hypothetical protein
MNDEKLTIGEQISHLRHEIKILEYHMLIKIGGIISGFSFY